MSFREVDRDFALTYLVGRSTGVNDVSTFAVHSLLIVTHSLMGHAEPQGVSYLQVQDVS